MIYNLYTTMKGVCDMQEWTVEDGMKDWRDFYPEAEFELF